MKRTLRTFLLFLVVLSPTIATGVGLERGECEEHLDEETLNILCFNTQFDTVDVRPGAMVDFDLIDPRSRESVNACVVWSVSTQPDVATIDHDTGVLEVGPIPILYPIVVTANIEGCRRIKTIEVNVYRPEDRPLVGAWREIRRLNCNGTEQTRGDPVVDLVFQSDGRMYVLFRPFEFGYFDYWGRYAADTATGGFTFEVRGTNQQICCTHQTGKFSIDQRGRLVFERVSFGAIGTSGRRACTYVFERR